MYRSRVKRGHVLSYSPISRFSPPPHFLHLSVTLPLSLSLRDAKFNIVGVGGSVDKVTMKVRKSAPRYRAAAGSKRL